MKYLYRFKQLILLCGDLVTFSVGFWLSLGIRNVELPTTAVVAEHAVLFGFLFFLWVVINYINGLYDLSYTTSNKWYQRTAEAALLSFIISIFLLYLLPQKHLTPKTILMLNIVFGYALSILWRLLYERIIGDHKLYTKIITVGYSKEIQELLEIVTKHPEKGYRIVAIIDEEQHVQSKDLPPNTTLYKSLAALRPAITTHGAHMVVTAPHMHNEPNVLRELYELLFWPVHITNFSSLYETLTNRVSPSTFSESWFLSNLTEQDTPVYNKFRRFLDYVGALVMGIVLLALLPFIALLIKLNSKGPIFFSQKRIGQYGNIFKLYKFRTMYALAPDGSAEQDGAQFAVKGDKRVTAVGKILRKTRIDEIPQVINLIRGDVTLIGPRPERPEIVEKLEEKMSFYPLRHIVKPGITGWAAIHQHYTDTLEKSLQKLQYDLYYIKNRSFLLDLSILLRTVNVVLRMLGQ